MAKKQTNRNARKKSGPSAGRNSANNQPQGTPPPAVTPDTDTLTGRLGGYAGSAVGGAGRMAGNLAGGGYGANFGRNFEAGMTGTDSGIGSTIGRGGALYGLGKLLRMGFDKYTAEPAEQKKPLVTKEVADYRNKVAKDVTGGISKFDQRALDVFSNNQDEGWRNGIKSIQPDKYKKLAVSAIKSNDPSSLWDEVVLAAKTNGKNVNGSKPVYLPQRFTKNGKEYAYAIDPSETAKGGKPKLITIQLGGGVVWDQEQSK